MKILTSFGKAEEAHLLRARLEGSGIAAYVRDENIVTADWLYSGAVGGVKVEVQDEDFEAASDLLRNDAGEPGESPKKIRTYSSWHYVRVCGAFALCTFVFVAVRIGAIARPGAYAIPAIIGLLVGMLAAAVEVVRTRPQK
jgi:hypothetical protein